MIKTLMVYTVTTGLLTSLVALVLLIVAVALPKSPAYLSVPNWLENVYVSALLATLNRRDEIKKEAMPMTGVITLPLESLGTNATSEQGIVVMGSEDTGTSYKS
ncbi:hypothetical protein JR316_0007532 [Psilocybe cubensis]|uniref:Uncharacterized protein n=1 Tax=Psilocybe cubensis TaxID=181762 RepID=A0ACB8GZP0_PSICU|nr:hypothetical protein JR316_0007532 [Psilocybe cubensis]KAH9480929.1 hypothetical protein JR316_0007532 [Psilocybe cubensis]